MSNPQTPTQRLASELLDLLPTCKSPMGLAQLLEGLVRTEARQVLSSSTVEFVQREVDRLLVERESPEVIAEEAARPAPVFAYELNLHSVSIRNGRQFIGEWVPGVGCMWRGSTDGFEVQLPNIAEATAECERLWGEGARPETRVGNEFPDGPKRVRVDSLPVGGMFRDSDGELCRVLDATPDSHGDIHCWGDNRKVRKRADTMVIPSPENSPAPLETEKTTDRFDSVLGSELREGDVVPIAGTTVKLGPVFATQSTFREFVLAEWAQPIALANDGTFERLVRPAPVEAEPAACPECGIRHRPGENTLCPSKPTPVRVDSLKVGDKCRSASGEYEVTGAKEVNTDAVCLVSKSGDRLWLKPHALVLPSEPSPTVASAPPPLVVQVGRRYRRRDGVEVECTRDSAGSYWSESAPNQGRWHWPNGRWEKSRDTGFDLIEDLGPVASEPPKCACEPGGSFRVFCPTHGANGVTTAAPEWLTDEMVELLRSGTIEVGVLVRYEPLDAERAGQAAMLADALVERLAPHLDDERKAMLAEAGR